jgi:hypothetical protein
VIVIGFSAFTCFLFLATLARLVVLRVTFTRFCRQVGDDERVEEWLRLLRPRSNDWPRMFGRPRPARPAGFRGGVSLL